MSLVEFKVIGNHYGHPVWSVAPGDWVGHEVWWWLPSGHREHATVRLGERPEIAHDHGNRREFKISILELELEDGTRVSAEKGTLIVELKRRGGVHFI